MFRHMYDTEAYKALRANIVWKDSGYGIGDIIDVDRINMCAMPKNISDLMFVCPNEELEPLYSLIRKVQAEQCRMEANKMRAAVRGTAIHKACDAIDEGSEPDSQYASFAEAYKSLREDEKLKPICSEYLVSDNEFVASSIDLVLYDENNDIHIADIKCVSKMDDTYINYVSWQLSIYKYLFELQNPKKKVKQLHCVWLPKEQYGSPKMFTVRIIPKEEVIALLQCAKEGRDYAEIKPFSLPDTVTTALDEYLEAKRMMKQYKAVVDDFESKLNTIFKDNDIKKYEIEGKVTFTRTLPTTSQKFDSARFKAEHPDIYEQYITTSQREGSLRVTIK